jgi:hypothetical protein
VGNWLSLRQAQTLLSAPDITTLRGLRDRAILAVLLGCGGWKAIGGGCVLSRISGSAMAAGASLTWSVSMAESLRRCRLGESRD